MMVKTNQHYVPRLYLKAWSVNGKIWCLKNGRIREESLRRVASEDLFYRLQDLTAEDVFLIKKFVIERSTKIVQPLHLLVLDTFLMPLMAKKILSPSDPRCDELNEIICNTEENFHSEIERDLEKFLALMLVGDVDFFGHEGESMKFLLSITVQYMRTKRIREAMVSDVSIVIDGADMRRSWNVMSHLFAITMAHSFHCEKAKYRLAILENSSGVPFITGDQPVINLHANLQTSAAPTKCELFYPLSPRRAMLMLEKPTGLPSGKVAASLQQVEGYNDLIVKNSDGQIFAESKQSLQRFLTSKLAVKKLTPTNTAS
jgi:hypothetical protein